ncbi:MAG: transcriptional regulator, IclR family [Pseudonocardiales bacterium]|nr:transcriptional regulator, IclR family [Pseudonocardiales bacterium]
MTAASEVGAVELTGSDRPTGSMLQSVQRAVALIQVVSQHPGLTAQQLAEQAGIERTGAHRLLRTLEVEGLVERDGKGYRLGARNLLFGNSYLAQHALRQVSLPYQIDLLYRIFADKPWSLAVLIRVGRTVTLVSHLWSPTAPLDSLLTIGLSGRVERAAGGRCILAFLAEGEVVELLGTDAAQEIRPRLDKIRAAGGLDYVSGSEVSGAPTGLYAMSACIRDRKGSPIAALTLSGTDLEQHLNPESEPANHLLRTARQIGAVIT